MPAVDLVAETAAGRLLMNQSLGLFSLYYYQAHARDEMRQALHELTEPSAWDGCGSTPAADCRCRRQPKHTG
ncbi:hypothetical protein ACWD4G_26345 [Streptomyces sp. NPDC002643]